MEQQEYEREIDLRNLLYYVLCRWKLLFAAGFLCMAALGGYKYVSVGSEQTDTVVETEDDVLQMVQDVLDGLRDQNTLKGNALLYYNLLSKNRAMDDKIVENRSLIEGSQSQLENLESQRAEFEQNASAGDGDALRDMRETIWAYLISTCEKNRTSAEYMIKTLEEKKAENEKNAAILLETIEQEKAAQEAEAVAVAVNPTRMAVKFGAVGLVGGIFGAAFIICLIYLFSGKLLDAAALKDMHGLRVLSVIPVREARKGLDGLIDKVKGTLFQTKEEAYNVVYGRMFNLADGLMEKTILVTGAAEEGHVQELTEYLRKKDGSVKYIVSMNPIENLDALPVFRQADEILLVEQIGKSRLEEIRRELCFIDDVKKRPLGVVVVE